MVDLPESLVQLPLLRGSAPTLLHPLSGLKDGTCTAVQVSGRVGGEDMRDISVLSLACKVVLLEQLYSGMSQQVDLLHSPNTNIILSLD